ncbi:hypothetical protein GCM10017744_065460 [Streptomyces antimycoticus]
MTTGELEGTMARPLGGTPGTHRPRGRWRALLALRALALAALAAAAVPPAPAQAAPAKAAARAGCQGPVTPAPQQTVEDCDTPARIIDKAVHTVPTPGSGPGRSARSPPSPTSA